ncbi:MAG: hypothetical protein WCC80_05200, partial [Pseudolabrys sp.]
GLSNRSQALLAQSVMDCVASKSVLEVKGASSFLKNKEAAPNTPRSLVLASSHNQVLNVKPPGLFHAGF